MDSGNLGQTEKNEKKDGCGSREEAKYSANVGTWKGGGRAA